MGAGDGDVDVFGLSTTFRFSNDEFDGLEEYFAAFDVEADLVGVLSAMSAGNFLVGDPPKVVAGGGACLAFFPAEYRGEGKRISKLCFLSGFVGVDGTVEVRALADA